MEPTVYFEVRAETRTPDGWQPAYDMRYDELADAEDFARRMALPDLRMSVVEVTERVVRVEGGT